MVIFLVLLLLLVLSVIHVSLWKCAVCKRMKFGSRNPSLSKDLDYKFICFDCQVTKDFGEQFRKVTQR